MADAQVVKGLAVQFEALGKSDLASNLKKDLGVESIYNVFEPRIHDVLALQPAVLAGASHMDVNQVNSLQNAVQNIRTTLDAIGQLQTVTFAQQKPDHVVNLNRVIDAFLYAATPFITWYLFERLEGGIVNEIRSEIATIRTEIGQREQVSENKLNTLNASVLTSIDTIKKDAASVIENVKQLDLAKRSEFRQMSLGVSREQFSDLRRRFVRGSIAFGILGGVTIGALIWFLLHALNSEHAYASNADAIATSVIRVTLVGVMGALIAVFAKLFRGNLNMYYHTLHREHLATIIQNFVNAGENADQRGAIFLKLVDAVAAFGSSGLITGADEGASLKIISDLPNLLKGEAPK
jgi:hypothetical protein